EPHARRRRPRASRRIASPTDLSKCRKTVIPTGGTAHFAVPEWRNPSRPSCAEASSVQARIDNHRTFAASWHLAVHHIQRRGESHSRIVHTVPRPEASQLSTIHHRATDFADRHLDAKPGPAVAGLSPDAFRRASGHLRFR